MDSLKEALKAAREKHGLTQKELAARLNMNIRNVQNWEQGISTPDLKTLKQLQDIYHCDLDHLTGDIKANTHDVQFIMDETGLTEEAIERLRSINNLSLHLHKSIYRPRFIAGLISYMLTDGYDNLKMAADRIVLFNRELHIFEVFPDIVKTLLNEAYDYATEDFSLEYPDGRNYKRAEEKFRAFIKQKFEKNPEICDAIIKEEPDYIIDIDYHDDPRDLLYGETTPVYLKDLSPRSLADYWIESLDGLYDTMFYISDERRMIMDTLNSTNLYEIVRDYNKSLNK